MFWIGLALAAPVAEAVPLREYNYHASADVSLASESRFPAGVNTPIGTGNLAAFLNFVIEREENAEGPIQANNVSFSGPAGELALLAAKEELAALIGDSLEATRLLLNLGMVSAFDISAEALGSASLVEFVDEVLTANDIDPAGLRQGTMIGVGDTDPFLAFEVIVANPYDEPATFRFEQQLEIEPLDEFLAVREGFFLAEVFDTGGDAGASLSYNLGFTSRLTDDGSELSTLSSGGSITDADPAQQQLIAESFIGAGSEIDAMLGSAFLTLSPGDTARVQLIGSFGDDVMPLVPVGEIRDLLDFSVDAVDSLRAIPEPAAAVLLTLAMACLAARRA